MIAERTADDESVNEEVEGFEPDWEIIDRMVEERRQARRSCGIFSRYHTPVFIPRKAHEPGGMGYQLRKARGLDPLVINRETAGWRDGEPVTWREIHAERAAKQREHLDGILRVEVQWPKPAQLWVFYVPGPFFAGWWVYISHFKGGRRETLGVGGLKGDVTEREVRDLMRLWPCGLLAGVATREQWCEAFAKQYARKKTRRDPRKAGLLTGWTDGMTFRAQKADFLKEGEAHGS